MICLISIGKVNKKILSFLKAELKKEFEESVEIQKPLADPDYTYNPFRDQCNASTILRQIEHQRPGLCKRTLGVTEWIYILIYSRPQFCVWSSFVLD